MQDQDTKVSVTLLAASIVALISCWYHPLLTLGAVALVHGISMHSALEVSNAKVAEAVRVWTEAKQNSVYWHGKCVEADNRVQELEEELEATRSFASNVAGAARASAGMRGIPITPFNGTSAPPLGGGRLKMGRGLGGNM